MKKLITTNQGGHPLVLDDLGIIQDNIYTAIVSIFRERTPFVLYGCDVEDNGDGTVDISSGVVFIQDEFMRFDGATNVILANGYGIKKGNPVDSDPKQFSNGQTKNVYREIKAELDLIANIPGPYIEVKLPNLTLLRDFISIQLDFSQVASRLISSNEGWKQVGAAGSGTSYNDLWAASTDTTVFPLQFRKDFTGKVYLRGVASSNGSVSKEIFTLPNGYRPSKTIYVPIVAYGGGNEPDFAIIEADGKVSVGLGNYNNYDLSSVSFYPAGL